MRSARSNTTPRARPWPAAVQWRGRRTRTDHRDPLARALVRNDRCDPSLIPSPIDDRHLDLLDRDRILVDAEHARRLARRWAETAGELGKVVRGVQSLDGVAQRSR